MHKLMSTWLFSLFLAFVLFTSTTAQAMQLYQDEKNTFDFGGGLSIYYITDEKNNSEINDGFSRFNFDFKRDLGDGWTGFSFIEWGIQVSSTDGYFTVGNNGLTSSGPTADTIWLRQGFVGFNHDTYGKFTIGKQWGVSYDVGGVTDWFEVFGGSAQGTYNFGTDGGFSGTGIAEQAIQYRITFDKLTLSAQLMATSEVLDFKEEQPISVPPKNYSGTLNVDDSYGFSITYKAPYDIGLGVAYNNAKLKVGDVQGNSLSVNDELTGAFITYRNFGQPGLHLALALTNMKNHDFNDAKEVMEEANGIEFLSMYRFDNPFAVIAGFISLDDVSNSDLIVGTNGKYKNEYFILSAKYYWEEDFFLYVEQKIDNSTSSDPINIPVPGNAIGLGMRFDF